MMKSIVYLLVICACLFSEISAQNIPQKTSMQEHVSFEGWPNCIRLSNGSIELIVTTDVGPRIIRFGFINGDNLFYISPEDKGKTGGNDWHIYGGHRFWHSPEVAPRTYSPDNNKVRYTWNGKTLKLTQDIEPSTAIVKEIEITLNTYKNEVEVLHRIINKGSWEVELAPWAISACAAGGRAIVPQEPYIDPAAFLLPSRPLVLWAYTKMTDPRYAWGEKYIQAKQDPSISSETKIGVLNKQKWVAFCLNNNLFVKTFGYDPKATYPDYGCNNEIYICGGFLEVESLGPLSKIQPNEQVNFTENWTLHRVDRLSESEVEIEEILNPLLKTVQN